MAENGKLDVLILVVHPFTYVFHGIAQQVADYSHGMALACAVCSVYPKTLVVVYVVSTHTLYYSAQYVIELLIGDK